MASPTVDEKKQPDQIVSNEEVMNSMYNLLRVQQAVEHEFHTQQRVLSGLPKDSDIFKSYVKYMEICAGTRASFLASIEVQTHQHLEEAQGDTETREAGAIVVNWGKISPKGASTTEEDENEGDEEGDEGDADVPSSPEESDSEPEEVSPKQVEPTGDKVTQRQQQQQINLVQTQTQTAALFWAQFARAVIQSMQPDIKDPKHFELTVSAAEHLFYSFLGGGISRKRIKQAFDQKRQFVASECALAKEYLDRAFPPDKSTNTLIRLVLFVAQFINDMMRRSHPELAPSAFPEMTQIYFAQLMDAIEVGLFNFLKQRVSMEQIHDAIKQNRQLSDSDFKLASEFVAQDYIHRLEEAL